MNQSQISRWTLLIDPASTRDIYEKIEAGHSQICECQTCRNLVLARPAAFAPRIQQMLETLGIDPTKDAECPQYYASAAGMHTYGPWYHFVGKILSGEDCWHDSESNFERLSSHEEIGISTRTSFIADPFIESGLSILQLELHLELPWVLPETYDENR